MAEVNPYLTPEAALDDAEEVSSANYTLASRGIRLLAAIVDGLVYFGIAFLSGLLVPALPTEYSEFLPIVILVIVVAINVTFLVQNAQTVGKKVCGIRIIRPNGEKASFGRILGLRYLLNGLIGIIPFYALIDILFIFREDRRCIHDMIADTLVEEVKTRR